MVQYDTNVVIPKNVVLQKAGVWEFVKKFRAKIADTHRANAVLRYLIRKTVKDCVGSGKNVNWGIFASNTNMVRAIKASKEFPQYCRKHDIFCSFCLESGKCDLKKMGQACLETLRDKMKEKYN